MEKIYIGSDHGGFKLKEAIKEVIKEEGYEPEDLGCYEKKSCDYPDYAKAVGEKVAEENARGILICGTGIGMCIAANKVKGVRAGFAYDEFTAQMAREHNNSNILCLGERALKEAIAKEVTKIWLKTEFSSEERHHRRVDKIMEIEE